MSDYVSGLRQDLVEAAARQQAAGRGARVTRRLRPRAWSPVVVVGAVVALAAIVVLVLGLRAVNPPRPPEAPRHLGTFQIGGEPRDAAAVGGHVVVADADGSLLLVEPGGRRPLMPATPRPQSVSLAADGTALWAVKAPSKPLGGSELMKLDGSTGRRLGGGGPLHGEAGSIALGAGGIWMTTDVSSVLAGGRHFSGLEKLDPRTGKRMLVVPREDAEGLAASGRSVWTRRGLTVTERDERARVLNRVRGISPTVRIEGQRTMVADNDGAWVVGQSDGLLYRIEGGRVVKQLQVGALSGVIARTRSAVWVTALNGHRWELVRVDPDDGTVTGRVAVGDIEPQTIVPVGKEVWVITPRGGIMRFSQG